MAKEGTKIKTKDYYYCPRCEQDSLGDSMTPCPRGGCEARIEGTVTITKSITIDRTISPEQEQWNKENYR